ncbi:MAG: hypothetical protein JO199_07635, partial [Candidatus Eremiobacteraeota bacterium]|nr:hypothetical protein [Candidatus Eremiobacteraeota bacterium]
GSNAASLALALRRGLAPRELLLRLAGSLPGEDVLLAMASGEYRFDVAPIDLVRHGIGLDALDRETRGTVRSDRHEHFAERAVGNAFFLNGEMVAYAYCWGDGRIGPIAASSSAYVVQLFAFVLATLNRTHGATWCTLIAPASNVRLTRAALRAGLRIEDRWLLATDLQRADFSRYVAYHRLGI